MTKRSRRNHSPAFKAKVAPGVGPVIATALVAAVGDGRHFRSGRELAAWIGLVPRQYTTGGKPRLGGIGRRANHYLRRQMVHGQMKQSAQKPSGGMPGRRVKLGERPRLTGEHLINKRADRTQRVIQRNPSFEVHVTEQLCWLLVDLQARCLR
jgi:transposase